MKKVLVNVKQNYQLYIAALTIVAITACFVVGQLQQKAQAAQAKAAIEKCR